MVEKREILLPLLSEPPVVDETRPDCDGSTLLGELEDEHFLTSFLSDSDRSDVESDTEHEILTVILNKEPCELNLRE